MGLLGCEAFTVEELAVELAWIEEHIDGRPYSIDVLDSTETFPGQVSVEINNRGVCQRVTATFEGYLFVVDVQDRATGDRQILECPRDTTQRTRASVSYTHLTLPTILRV